jgi:hypothetical protein
MASEMRRAAKALVESRVETFEVKGSAEAARERVERALAGLGTPRALRYAGAWSTADGRTSYAATFAPEARTPLVLNLISLVILGLVTASAWAVVTDAGSLKFLLPLGAVLALLAMPLVIAGLAARREAEESRITRAIRAALAAA